MVASTSENGPIELAHVSRATVADAGERLLVLSVYCYLIWRLAMPIVQGQKIGNLLLLASEGLVVAFLILRRPTTRISTSWWVWMIALSASLAPMLVNPSDDSGLISPVVGAGLMVMGLVIQVHAKLTLGRSFGCVPAHRGLKLNGPYRFVRHPMYAGYLLSHVAFLLMNPTIRNAVVYAAAYALQIPRLLAEERLLSWDPRYCEYRREVPYRLVPYLF